MKRLVLEVRNVPGWGKLLKVKEQTHRESEFGHNGSTFFNCDGFTLHSVCYPDTTPDSLCVRGSANSNDRIIIQVPSDEWLDRCRAAVKTYNKFFAEEKECKEIEKDVEVIE